MGSSGPLNVIVVWTGYRPGPWVLRALKAAGHRPIGVSPDPAGGRSTACLRPLRCPSPSTSPDGFLASLETLCRERGAHAVLPLSENAVEVLAERVEEGLAGAVIVGPDAGQYVALCDKTALRDTVAAAGLESPAGVTVGREGPTGPWPSFPSIVKLRATAMGDSAIEVLVVHDERGRAAAVEAILSAGHEAVVQERVIGTHWTVHAVRGADGRFAAVLGRIERTFPRGAGMPSVISVLAREGPAIDAARRVLDQVDYRGLANVQLFERADGLFVVHDVNLRPPAPVALSIRAGLNLPALAVEATVGREWAAPRAPLRPFAYISRFDEMKGLVNDVCVRGPMTALRRAARVHGRGRRLVDPPLRDPLWLARVPRGVARRARAQIAPARR